MPVEPRPHRIGDIDEPICASKGHLDPEHAFTWAAAPPPLTKR